MNDVTSHEQLPDKLHAKIKQLCTAGDKLVDEGRHSDAITQFEEALSLLPPPSHRWNAATWLYTALGDTHFKTGDFQAAREMLNAAILCPEALENPFIWLRRGQVYFELNDMSQASDCLASAFMLGGKEILEGEDPKYAEFILPKLRSAEYSNPSRKWGVGIAETDSQLPFIAT